MLVFISPRFVISDCCIKEVNLADLLRLPIIPVMIEKTPWPPPGSLALIMSQHIYVDLAGTGGHGGCGRDADWSIKIRELIRRLRIFTSPAPKDVLEPLHAPSAKPAAFLEVVEAIEAAPVGSVRPESDRETSEESEDPNGTAATEGNNSWAGAAVAHPDPGRVPCCVNAFSFPSVCTIF